MRKFSFGLVGDVGGTNCRFALVRLGDTALDDPRSFRGADFPNLLDAIEAYFGPRSPRPEIDWAIIAVAGAIAENAVTLTNRSWHISGDAISERFGIGTVLLINDFTALAGATEHMRPENLVPLGGNKPESFNGVATTAIIGPGTGLGVGGLVRGANGALTLTTEGGHTAFAPNDDTEHAIARVLGERFDRISNERLLSGDGLKNIHWALSRLKSAEPEALRASEISHRAKEKSDPFSVEAVQVFSRLLGSFAGDVVLTLGARNGLYIAGGMLPAIIDSFDRAAFRARFEDKGRFRAYMAPIPAWLMIRPFAALVGAAALADSVIGADG